MYDTDLGWDFRQESFFQYLFGVKEPDVRGLIRVSDGHAVLLIPELPSEYAVWLGPIKPPAWFQRAYEVDEVAFTKEITKIISNLGGTSLLILRGENRDSGHAVMSADLTGVEVPVDEMASVAFYDEICEARSIKSAHELAIMQFTNDVTSEAHIEVMRSSRGSTREHLAKAKFIYAASSRGCLRTAYPCICPSGSRNAVLHYGHANEPNSEVAKDGELTLRDMGAEYHCYAADVTCTYPISGKFSQQQREVYEAVWAAVLAVETSVCPGVCYKDMHRLAAKTMLSEMMKVGLFVGELNDLLESKIMEYFFPHGLGHQLGLDTHDVGGYAPGIYRSDDPIIKENLRLGRELAEGMVLTVEPGFYFNDFMLTKLLATPELLKLINREKLEELRPVGGVRIEDNIVITVDGCQLLTNVPRTVSEIEAVMAGQHWVVSAATRRKYTSVQKVQ